MAPPAKGPRRAEIEGGISELMSHERLGRILAGATLLAASALAHFVSPWFLLVAAGTGLSLAISGLTDRCPIKKLLIRMGFPGERDVGRAEAIKSAPPSSEGAAVPVNRLTNRERTAVN